MSKFAGFLNYLAQQKDTRITLHFHEIESYIGESLCPSAYKYRPYWHPSRTHTLANAIVDYGYDIEDVDLKNQLLYLVKK